MLGSVHAVTETGSVLARLRFAPKLASPSNMLMAGKPYGEQPIYNSPYVD